LKPVHQNITEAPGSKGQKQIPHQEKIGNIARPVTAKSSEGKAKNTH